MGRFTSISSFFVVTGVDVGRFTVEAMRFNDARVDRRDRVMKDSGFSWNILSSMDFRRFGVSETLTVLFDLIRSSKSVFGKSGA
jgi:hypothetical protein